MGSIEYLGATQTDDALVVWVSAHYAHSDDRVIVAHVSKSDATVPKNDLVTSQVRLPDCRLLRTGHDSATKPHTVFVQCEHLPERD